MVLYTNYYYSRNRHEIGSYVLGKSRAVPIRSMPEIRSTGGRGLRSALTAIQSTQKTPNGRVDTIPLGPEERLFVNVWKVHCPGIEDIVRKAWYVHTSGGTRGGSMLVQDCRMPQSRIAEVCVFSFKRESFGRDPFWKLIGHLVYELARRYWPASMNRKCDRGACWYPFRSEVDQSQSLGKIRNNRNIGTVP